MFSIIVPVFGKNRMEHFKVFMSSYKALKDTSDVPIELIVVEMVHSKGQVVYNNACSLCKYKLVKSAHSYERSKLLNEGVRMADYDYLVFHDVDVPLPECFIEELQRMAKKSSVFSNFREFFRMNEGDTKKVMSTNTAWHSYLMKKTGGKAEGQGAGWTKLSCTMSKKVYNSVGGWNEEFVGWGLEDDEMSRRLEHLGYKQTNAMMTLMHLWHPLTSPNWEKPEKSKKLYEVTKKNPQQVIDKLVKELDEKN